MALGNKPEFTFVIPPELLADLQKGCQRYEPVPGLHFTPQTNHNYDPYVAAWCINAIMTAYRQYCDKTKPNILPLDVEPDVTTLYWHEEFNYDDDKVRCGFIGKITPIQGDSTNRVIIALRGTEKIGEWVENIDYHQTEVSFNNVPNSVTIHKGFWNALTLPSTPNLNSFSNKIRTFFSKITFGNVISAPIQEPSLMDQIHELLPKYLSKTEKNQIYITGHSLGAAVATLLSLELILNFPNTQITTYVIGSPRVGGPSLSELFRNLSEDKQYNFSIWRLTNTEDVVTTVPLPVVRHLTYSQIFISKEGAPNTIGSITFSDNLADIGHNHDPLLYHYANEQLMDKKDDTATF